MPECVVAICTRSKIHGRGLCAAHYRWASRLGILKSFPIPTRQAKPRPPCAVDGCPKLAHHGALCSMHTERKRRTGSVGEAGLKKPHRSSNPTCSVEQCGRTTYGRGFCNLHYQRFRTRGTPGPSELLRGKAGDGCIELGYRSFAVNGKRKREHRMVWETANGPIPDGYVIHHKNGDKLDNRLENLEMMTRAQHRKHHHDDIQAGRN